MKLFGHVCQAKASLPAGCASALLGEVLAAGRNAAEVLPMAALAQEDLVRLLYTSGSTGLPKGAMYTDHIWRQVLTQNPVHPLP